MTAELSTSEARDAFLDNLESMATGSYLREEDREFWEPPYPVSVVDAARETVDSLVNAIRSIGQYPPEQVRMMVDAVGISNPDGTTAALDGAGESEPEHDQVLATAASAAIAPALEQLRALSAAHGDAVLDDEERADLITVIRAAARDIGADADALASYATLILDEE